MNGCIRSAERSRQITSTLTPGSDPGLPVLQMHHEEARVTARITPWKAVAAVAVTASLAFSGLGWVAVSATSAKKASSSQLKKMTGTAGYAANVATVWSWTENPQWLCALVPSCAGVENISTSSKERYRFGIVMKTPIPGTDGLGIVPVDVTVSKRSVGKSLKMHMAFSNSFGSFSSKATLSLAAKSSTKTKVTFTTQNASGSGIAGRLALKEMINSTKSQMKQSQKNYKVIAKRQVPMTLKLKTATPTKKQKKKHLTPVVPKFGISFPAGFEVPTPDAKLRVYIGGKKKCATTLVGTTAGTCTLKLSSSSKTEVLSILNGTLSNGASIEIGAISYLKAQKAGK